MPIEQMCQLKTYLLKTVLCLQKHHQRNDQVHLVQSLLLQVKYQRHGPWHAGTLGQSLPVQETLH